MFLRGDRGAGDAPLAAGGVGCWVRRSLGPYDSDPPTQDHRPRDPRTQGPIYATGWCCCFFRACRRRMYASPIAPTKIVVIIMNIEGLLIKAQLDASGVPLER